MKLSKSFRQHLGLTIIITVGATYIISLLVVGLLMTVTGVTALLTQIIRLIIAIIIWISVWNILGKEDLETRNDSDPEEGSEEIRIGTNQCDFPQGVEGGRKVRAKSGH